MYSCSNTGGEHVILPVIFVFLARKKKGDDKTHVNKTPGCDAHLLVRANKDTCATPVMTRNTWITRHVVAQPW